MPPPFQIPNQTRPGTRRDWNVATGLLLIQLDWWLRVPRLKLGFLHLPSPPFPSYPPTQSWDLAVGRVGLQSNTQTAPGGCQATSHPLESRKKNSQWEGEPVIFCASCGMLWLLEHQLGHLITFIHSSIHSSHKQLLRVYNLSRVLTNYLQTKKWTRLGCLPSCSWKSLQADGHMFKPLWCFCRNQEWRLCQKKTCETLTKSTYTKHSKY